ncbi:MAG TPA: neutral zinc metallopeptidase [Pseudomonadales bacterium]|nr:neutral zinc metallopeptidase [Pseudomonadales bacterium]HNC69236.1 neutral zinc metallopeptidase [Pseudomonadales bacterium]HND13365.1 neutral zinc metallopeptidase [Pseudomonadales bacterium]
MRWQQGRRSSNVEDRRDEAQPMQMGAGAAPLLLRVLPLLLRTRGGRLLLGIAALTLVGAQLLGIDVLSLLQGGVQSGAASAQRRAVPAGEQERTDFVAAVLGDIEDTWTAQFSRLGHSYQEPHLVLFRASVRSACGFAQSAMGPFYCPADQKIYLDLGFFDELAQRFGAPGDFAQAYVIAHEAGHHVQTLLGVSEKVQRAGQGKPKATMNALSVRQELQADCLAGVWGYHADRVRGILDPGDLEQALTAASAIGDDRLQREAQGYVVPDSFTHGSSEQRMHWFRRGFESGDIANCDTFGERAP